MPLAGDYTEKEHFDDCVMEVFRLLNSFDYLLEVMPQGIKRDKIAFLKERTRSIEREMERLSKEFYDTSGNTKNQ